MTMCYKIGYFNVGTSPVTLVIKCFMNQSSDPDILTFT